MNVGSYQVEGDLNDVTIDMTVLQVDQLGIPNDRKVCRSPTCFDIKGVATFPKCVEDGIQS